MNKSECLTCNIPYLNKYAGEKSNRNIVSTAAQLEVQNRAALDSCHPAPCPGFPAFYLQMIFNPSPFKEAILLKKT